MRDVVVYELLSLDGVAEEPGDWMHDSDRPIFDNLGGIIERQDDILLGRGTYDYWAGYWPTSDVEPFASFINRTPKHVFTSSPLDQEWANTHVVDRPATEYVAELKRREGGDIGVHGSITLAQSLLAAGLVDELRLVVSAAIAGSGRRLFDGVGRHSRLELVAAEHTPKGSLLLTYGRSVPPEGTRG
ncbi:dihydrofolate reductase family protein [Occultella kanbiaonis]|uniref:dihydrofolate reductase family protein n=1 Tax=Occultella kanbiaonis TaxID=2675754 RepID=UPI0012B6C19D|nr:dihydrofolate reductase family protein [Occultella kanbiaonis]